MNRIEQTLSAFITEKFGVETMDLVSEACEKLSGFDIKDSGTDLAETALFVFNNFKNLSKVSEAIDECSETHALAWDFNFDALDPWLMDEKHYCSDEKRSYYVSETMKALISIGLGVCWAIQKRDIYCSGVKTASSMDSESRAAK